MPNDYFQFKEFTIHQGDCAMKVSTDACYFGAIVDVSKAKSILDIGAGTGLLSLMIAQRSNAQINAVELDENAFNQARKNVEESPWSFQITHSSVQDYTLTNNSEFDHIICNPPFFVNSMKSEAKERNMARHTDTLSFDDLNDSIKRLLSDSGKASILLPISEKERFLASASKANLHLINQITFKDKPSSNDRKARVILVLSKHNKPVEKTMHYLKNEDGEYSEEFKVLLKPYYLHL